MTGTMTRRGFLGGLAAAGVMLAAASAPSPPRGRVMVVHGLGDSADSFAMSPAGRRLIAGLRAQRWAVDVVHVVGDGPEQAHWLQERFDQDPSGASVRDGWLRQFDRMARPDLVVGISWGGLLALHAAAATGVRYAALLPAAEPARLDEFSGYPLDALEIGRLHSDGYIAYALDDDRVGWEAAANLAGASGCERRTYRRLGHNLTEQVVDDLLGWVRPPAAAASPASDS